MRTCQSPDCFSPLNLLENRILFESNTVWPPPPQIGGSGGRGFAPSTPTAFKKAGETFILDGFDRSSWSKLGNTQFTVGQGSGGAGPQWEPSSADRTGR